MTNKIQVTEGYHHYKITCYLVLSCMIAATGGLIFGYDIGISGGVTSMGSFLNKFFPDIYLKMKNDDRISNYCKFNSQKLTFFTSSLYIAGLVATFFAAFVTKNYGRKSSILIGGAAFLIGSAVGGAASNIYMLITGRVLLGIGLGFTNQSAPLYLSETAPPHLRGGFVNGFEVFVGIGVIIANVINYCIEKISVGWGWRVSLAMAAAPASVLIIGSIFLHETPVTIIQNGGNHDKVKRVLQKIRGTSDVDYEFNDLVRASEISQSVKHPFNNLIMQKKYRPQLVMSIVLPFFNQMSGINVISFFAPMLFRTIGFSERQSLLLSLVVTGIVGTCSMSLSCLIVDKLGRRVLLCIGGILMFISLTVIGGVMIAELGDHGEMTAVSSRIVLVFVSIFVASFGVSWGPVSYLLTSEIFSLEIRSAAQSMNIAVQFFFTFVVAQVFLPMLCYLRAGIFFFFAGWVLVMIVFTYFFLPETNKLPIERMNQIWIEHWFWKKFVQDV